MRVFAVSITVLLLGSSVAMADVYVTPAGRDQRTGDQVAAAFDAGVAAGALAATQEQVYVLHYATPAAPLVWGYDPDRYPQDPKFLQAPYDAAAAYAYSSPYPYDGPVLRRRF